MGTAALEPARQMLRRQITVGLSEGEDCGLELPGNLAFPLSPPSVRSTLCALAEPLFLALSPQSY